MPTDQPTLLSHRPSVGLSVQAPTDTVRRIQTLLSQHSDVLRCVRSDAETRLRAMVESLGVHRAVFARSDYDYLLQVRDCFSVAKTEVVRRNESSQAAVVTFMRLTTELLGLWDRQVDAHGSPGRLKAVASGVRAVRDPKTKNLVVDMDSMERCSRKFKSGLNGLVEGFHETCGRRIGECAQRALPTNVGNKDIIAQVRWEIPMILGVSWLQLLQSAGSEIHAPGSLGGAGGSLRNIVFAASSLLASQLFRRHLPAWLQTSSDFRALVFLVCLPIAPVLWLMNRRRRHGQASEELQAAFQKAAQAEIGRLRNALVADVKAVMAAVLEEAKRAWRTEYSEADLNRATESLQQVIAAVDATYGESRAP